MQIKNEISYLKFFFWRAKTLYLKLYCLFGDVVMALLEKRECDGFTFEL